MLRNTRYCDRETPCRLHRRDEPPSCRHHERDAPHGLTRRHSMPSIAFIRASTIESRCCRRDTVAPSTDCVWSSATGPWQFSLRGNPLHHASSGMSGATINRARRGDGHPSDNSMHGSTLDGARFQNVTDDGTGLVVTPHHRVCNSSQNGIS
jgi:hypothetical protein